MLIEKKTPSFVTNDVLAIKLITGEEILARLVSETPLTITITKPVVMMITNIPNRPDQGYVGFAPFMLGIDDGAKLDIARVSTVVVSKAKADAAAKYLELTSDITVPSSDIRSKLSI